MQSHHGVAVRNIAGQHSHHESISPGTPQHIAVTKGVAITETVTVSLDVADIPVKVYPNQQSSCTK